MCRYWDIVFIIICFFSVMFVDAESDHLPPPKNLNFTWATAFTLCVRWEKPEHLDSTCKVNYTVEVHDGEVQQSKAQTQNLNYTLHVSNENGLSINVTTNPINCGSKLSSSPSSTTIPPPQVMLVSNLSCRYYSQNNMRCTWDPADDVQGLGFYYWLPKNQSFKKCSSYINETTKIRGCDIQSEYLKDILNNMFYMFNGTHKGISVYNTFKGPDPEHSVELNKPELKIKKVGHELFFQTIRSDLKRYEEHCYSYIYTYTKCNEKAVTVKGNMNHTVQYDPVCSYRVRVQIIFESYCGKGESEQSDEVEYGENSDPNLPVLLAVVIIPLIVSCCLIGSLVLLRRHKDVILPKIPEPSLFFKDMLNNNIRMTEERSPPVGRLYVPIEEIVESKISLEPETTILHNGP